jgi:DNA-binding NtrC family response regulator
MLMELGCDVHEASSAEEALRVLNRGFNAEFVITDSLMLGMSGTDLARKTREDRPSAKVLWAPATL